MFPYMGYDLSILIPARNEMFLAKTIENILENIEGNTEVIAVLDGAWAEPPVVQNERVTIIYFPESIGQRSATNQACRLSNARYIAKTDAHCAFDKGFDVKLMEAIKGHDDWTVVPQMRNLHAFDWVCRECGNRRYQGKSGVCEKCGGEEYRDIVWIAKDSPKSNFYRFDNTLHFQYWKEFEKRPEAQGDIAPTMGLQGSFFMLTRDKYWELNICDEAHGSWGQQGVEVACKTWLSGGQVMVVKNTWYAHMFRTQGGDFGFPYPNPGISKAREYSRDLWLNNKWPLAKHDLNWLIDKFAPVPDWDFTKGAIYYTDSRLENTPIAPAVRTQLREAIGDRRIVSISLEPLDFGDNIHLPLKRGYITMTKQILAGLKELQADVIFFCEHDVLYHPSHFDFVPPKKDVFYYNNNVWKVRFSDGHAVRTADMKQLSGMCAWRDLLVKHYEKRLELLEAKASEVGEDSDEFRRYVRRMGFEPGTHGRIPELLGKAESYEAKYPNVDIRHDNTLTPSKWSPEQFRNKKYAEGWQETDEIPGWGKFKELGAWQIHTV